MFDSNPRQLPSLCIDGSPVAPTEVFLHYQSSPFPGGHSYEWIIPKQLLPEQLLGKIVNLSPNWSDNEFRDWFFRLELVVSRWQRALAPVSPNTRLRYVLNTIDQVDALNEIVLRGQCSEFIRNRELERP